MGNVSDVLPEDKYQHAIQLLGWLKDEAVSQRQCARISGISPATFRAWRRGSRPGWTSYARLCELCYKLGCPLVSETGE